MNFLTKERRHHLRLRASDHRRRRHDETANTWTHFGGFLLSIVGCVLLLILSLLAIVPLWKALSPGGFTLLLTGGLAYTIGTLFFTFGHRRFFHAAWHLCVVAGSVLHYLAILGVLSRTP